MEDKDKEITVISSAGKAYYERLGYTNVRKLTQQETYDIIVKRYGS